MNRTTIMLDEELKARVVMRAREQGVSLAQWIRIAIARNLEEGQGGTPSDSLLADTAVFTGDAPADLSEQHDKYLYGDA